MKYYKNDANGEIRIVRQLGKNEFVVVKLLSDSRFTIKFWYGDLETTAKHWNTKPYNPSFLEKMALRSTYAKAMDVMRPLFSKV